MDTLLRVRGLGQYSRQGLFRQIYRDDSRANALNVQRRFRPLDRLTDPDIEAWEER